MSNMTNATAPTLKMMRKTAWTAKQEAGVLDVYLYDDIEPDSYDWRGETIKSETSAKHVKDLIENAQGVNQINVYINSYGGDVKEGLGIYNLLARHPARKTAYIDGYACSIASVIAMACDHIVMAGNALMMIHHAAACVYGNPEQLRKAADDVEVIDRASCSSYLNKAGEKLDEATLKQLLDAETWLDAEQCLAYGLCDEISKPHADKAGAAQEYAQNMRMIEKLQQMFTAPAEPPQRFAEQKTNAERLMALYKTKREGESK